VVTVAAGLGLVLAGADLVVWRPESLPLPLVMGTPAELPAPGVVRVAVGAAGVVEVKVLGEDTLRLEPREMGTTTMRVWTRDGARREYTVSVSPP
jgi:hypothetical protein